MKCEPSQHKKKDIKIVFGKRNDVSVRECFALILSLLAAKQSDGASDPPCRGEASAAEVLCVDDDGGSDCRDKLNLRDSSLVRTNVKALFFFLPIKFLF